MSMSTFRNNHQARGFSIEPMYQTWSYEGAILFFVQVKSESIKKRTILVTMGRMNEHTRRFVDDDQRWIFKLDIKRNFFGLHCRATRQVSLELDEVVRPELVTYVFDCPVYLAEA